MMTYINYYPLVGLLGLVSAALIYFSITRIQIGDPRMSEIADAIHRGAMVFLRREYSILAGFILVVFVALFLGVSAWTATAFLCGALSSMLAGFFGLKAATRSNVRTAKPPMTRVLHWL